MRLSSAEFDPQTHQGEKRVLNSELWHACAGPLISLPSIGSRVVYFPQGHSEQVAVSTNKEVDAHIPNYPSLPSQLICQLHNVTMHADVETDEVYAQMTLQPLAQEEQKDPYLPAELGIISRQPTNYFCKTLTASDTSTHGGFSVPRRAAEKVLPPLDYSLQPPAQELVARDLHDNEWKFRHVFRGQPKRHLLTTGWSVFVSAKRLVAGDSVLFIWNEKNQLLLGIKRANRSQTVMPSSVLSSDSMHLGLLAAAAHAAATNSRFTIFYNPRASPSEFVIPLVKYVKAVCHTRVSVGMRFRMLFETEESCVRRYMGTITGISDLDPPRWPNSHWRSVKVGWDESTAGGKQPRVSLWEIEPLTTFPMYSSPFHLRLKRPWPPELPSFPVLKDGHMGIMTSPLIQSLNFENIGGITPLIQPRLDTSMLCLQTDMYQAMTALQDIRAFEQLQPHMMQQSQSQPILFQNHIQENPESQSRAQTQPYFQQELQHRNAFNNQQQQLLQPVITHQPVPASVSPMSQIASASVSQNRQHNISDMSTFVSPLHSLVGLVPNGDTSQLLNLPRTTTQLMTSSGRPPKCAAVEPPVPSGAPRSCVPSIEPFGQPQTNGSEDLSSVFFSLFPGRECLMNRGGSADPQTHLFGADVEPTSFLMQNGLGSDSTTTPFTSSTYMSTAAMEFSANHAMAPSRCVDKSGFLQSQENLGQANPQNATFVKVYKSGSLGRSLDISKFNSYQELRGELARMFGLEGQLEDPLRSGWQLVFVDQENDVLLLGDDPWPEFVSSVWCIKILSPQDVWQMGKRGLELLNSVPNGSPDNFGSHHNSSRNLSSGVTSVGSLEY